MSTTYRYPPWFSTRLWLNSIELEHGSETVLTLIWFKRLYFLELYLFGNYSEYFIGFVRIVQKHKIVLMQISKIFIHIFRVCDCPLKFICEYTQYSSGIIREYYSCVWPRQNLYIKPLYKPINETLMY